MTRLAVTVLAMVQHYKKQGICKGPTFAKLCRMKTIPRYLFHVNILSLLMDLTCLTLFPCFYITTITYSPSPRGVHLQKNKSSLYRGHKGRGGCMKLDQGVLVLNDLLSTNNRSCETWAICLLWHVTTEMYWILINNELLLIFSNPETCYVRMYPFIAPY